MLLSASAIPEEKYIQRSIHPGGASVLAKEHATALRGTTLGERMTYWARIGFEYPVLGHGWASFTRAPEDSSCSGDETASRLRVDRESFGVRLHCVRPPHADCETVAFCKGGADPASLHG